MESKMGTMEQLVEQQTMSASTTVQLQRPEIAHQIAPRPKFSPLGIAASFGLPLLVVFAGLRASTKYVDVFDEASLLPTRLQELRSLGFVTSLEDIESRPLAERDNVFSRYKRMVANGEIEEEKWLLRPANFREDQLPKDKFLRQLKVAQELAKFRHLKISQSDDATTKSQDFDQVACDSLIRLLQYSYELARHNRGADALKVHEQAFNFYLQYCDDPRLFPYVDQGMFPTLLVRTGFELTKQFSNNRSLQDRTIGLMHKYMAGIDEDVVWNRGIVETMRFWVDNDVVASSAVDWRRPMTKQDTGWPSEFVLPKRQFAQGMLSRSLAYMMDARTATRSGKSKRDIDERLAAVDKQYANKLTGRSLENLKDIFASSRFEVQRARTEMSAWIWAAEIVRDYGTNLPNTLDPRPDPGVGNRLTYRRLGDSVTVESDGLELLASTSKDPPQRFHIFVDMREINFSSHRRSIDLNTCLFGGKDHISPLDAWVKSVIKKNRKR